MFAVHEPAGNYSAPLYEIRRTPKMTHQRNNSDMENNQEIGIGNILSFINEFLSKIDNLMYFYRLYVR